jgi:hypothetical protein
MNPKDESGERIMQRIQTTIHRRRFVVLAAACAGGVVWAEDQPTATAYQSC